MDDSVLNTSAVPVEIYTPTMNNIIETSTQGVCVNIKMAVQDNKLDQVWESGLNTHTIFHGEGEFLWEEPFSDHIQR